MSPFSQFLAQVFGFLILVAIIWKFAWKHIVNIFQNRREEIRRKMEESERGSLEAKVEMENYSRQLGDIDQQAKDRLDAAEKEARTANETLVTEAREQARQETDRAKREVIRERDKALLELRLHSIDLTLRVAEKLIDRAMDDATHKTMVQKYLNALEGSVQK